MGALALVAAVLNWRDDIRRTGLDPRTPFQTYRPPQAPDYASPTAWAALPSHLDAPVAADGSADVFFVHSTTFVGGGDWNGSVLPKGAGAALLARVVLPNYASPFARAGRVFAPRYRQASLYSTQMSLRDDAREARTFAYRDVAAAFDTWRRRWGGSRPFILVGVEQGGALVERLAREVSADPALQARLVAVYQLESPAAAGRAPAACMRRSEYGCRVAYVSALAGDFTAAARLLDRAQVWTSDDRALEDLHGRTTMCVNPLTGASGGVAVQKANLGAANATGLEWGVRPAFLAHQVSATCEGGVLRISPPRSPDLKRSGSWTDRLMVRPYNFFWADLEADALARRDAWLAARTGSAARP